MDATAPGITSPFQVGNRRKGRCQIHLFQLLKKTRVSQKPNRFLLMSNWPGHCQNSPIATKVKVVFMFQALEWRLLRKAGLGVGVG